jgi:hypothetical protein
MIRKAFGLFARLRSLPQQPPWLTARRSIEGALDARLTRAKAIIEMVDRPDAQEAIPDRVERARLAWTLQGPTWSNWLNWNNLNRGR